MSEAASESSDCDRSAVRSSLVGVGIFERVLMTCRRIVRYDARIKAACLRMVHRLMTGGSIVVGTRALVRARSIGCGIVLGVLLLSFGCERSGQPEAVWCETGTGPAQVIYPRAITYDKRDDTFFIVDRAARVQHLDSRGNYINSWRVPRLSSDKQEGAEGVAVGPDGNVYIAGTHEHHVVVFTTDGKMLRYWGGMGTKPGEFIYPSDIVFDSKGNVFVSEYGDNDRVQVFDQQGKLLYAFGHFGSGRGEFSRPQSMVMDHDTLYIADACNHRIDVFKSDGTFVRSMGKLGSGPGQFRFPFGLCEDRDGNLIVCEFGNNRVQAIDKRTGKCLGIWGRAGRDPGQLAYPWGVAVDRRNRVIAMDAGNNRLQVFWF